MELSLFLSKVQNAKELDFGDIMGKSIELFKKTWLHGFLSFLFMMILIFPMVLIIYAPMLYYAIAQEGQHSSEFPIGMMLITFVLAMVIGMLLNTFVMALQAGFFNVIRVLDRGEEVEAKDHFVFFKSKHLKKTFVLSLITTGISMLAMMLCYIPIVYVVVPLLFVPIIFANNTEFSVTEIIKVSFSLGNKKWLISFGLIFISGVLAYVLGALLCGIGIFFTMSFVYLPVYVVYKEVIGFEEGEDDDEIYQIGIDEE